MDIKTKHELDKYILSRKYYCPLCQRLQTQIAKYGIGEIAKWEGEICEGIKEMKQQFTKLNS